MECLASKFKIVYLLPAGTFHGMPLQYIQIMNLTILLGLAAACGTTISFIPQAVKTIRTKDTSGISLSMYSLFAFGTLLWLLYGIVTNNIPVYIANGITLIFSLIILAFKIKYK
jgi:MtN3 and saliva related transmembrane protein